MNQQLSALLGMKSATGTPGTFNTTGLAAANDAPQAFANVLTDTLSGLAPPDATLQMLLAGVAAAVSAEGDSGSAADLILSTTAADEPGNRSPESGSDLPQLLLASDPTKVLLPELTPNDELVAQLGLPDATHNRLSMTDGLDASPSLTESEHSAASETDALAANLGVPDLAPSTLDLRPVAANAVAQPALPAAVLAAAGATIGVVEESGVVTGNLSALAPAAARTSGAALATTSVSTFNSYNVSQEPSAPMSNAAVQAASQDQPALQKHSRHELDLITAVAAVLIPVKERSVEQLQMSLPTTSPAMSPDATAASSNGSPLNSSVSLTPGATATANPPIGKSELAIAQTPGQPGWSDVFADRVTFAVRQSLQEAEIRLNPPQLGQVDVRIVMNNDQANLMFSSPHGAVREAIELSIGRLRDMLADSGFNLVNVDVSDKSLAQQRNDAREQRESGRSGAAGYRADFELAVNAPEVLRATGTGSIDYYV